MTVNRIIKHYGRHLQLPWKGILEAGERCLGDVCACAWVASAVLCSWAAGVIGAVAAVAVGADTATAKG
jgi:hypothetical protein